MSNRAYQEQQFKGSCGLAFYRVVVRQVGDVAERVDHGVILVNKVGELKEEAVTLA
jgi:hypothetical protein